MSELYDQLLTAPTAEADLIVRVCRALIFILVGVLTAWLVSRLLARLLHGTFRLVGTRFPTTTIGTSRVNRVAVQVLPQIVFWFLFVVFLGLGTEALGLPFLTAWMTKVLDYLPTVLTAALLILAGIWGGIAVRQAISRTAGEARLPYAHLFGRMAQVAIVIVAIVISASQLGVDISFLLVVGGILAGTLLFSVGLAFGLGASTMVGNIIGCHYLRGLYRVGNTVEVDGVEGNIVKITGAFVVVETKTGQVCIPARQFSQSRSTLIRQTQPRHDD